MENDSNKKRKLNDPNDPTDFLNFDYGFPINTSQDPTIPDDFFLFVTDQANAENNQNNGFTTNNNNNINNNNSNDTSRQILNAATPTSLATATINTNTTVPTPPLQQQQLTPATTVATTMEVNNFEPPNQAVFTIAVGGRVFRLSWESLKSDGPSNFFLEYFRKKRTKVMYIDRDPDIFELIVRHLRGYYVRPVDDIQAQSLLFDAGYYGLTRLKKTLQEYLYVNVGGRVFRLPWDLFRKDGTHNFFTGPLMHSFLSPHGTDGTPPIYIDRDPDIFADIVNHLRGYTIHIRDEMHRKNLLKDAQYYVFRQLSDKLLTAQQSVAGFGEGVNREVLLLLQDVRVVNMLESKATQANTMITKPLNEMTSSDWSFSQIQYKRAADGPPHALLVQIGDISMQIHRKQYFNNNDDLKGVMDGDDIKLTFEMEDVDMKKMRSMAHVAKASKGVNHQMCLDSYCAMTIDDTQVKSLKTYLDMRDDESSSSATWEICQKCEQNCTVSRIILQRAICGVHLVDNMITLCALRLEAISSQFRLNLKRQFLPG